MAYLLVEDFKAGLDTRKSPLTAAAGTLQVLVNAAITPGGEIEKRRAFVKVATLTGTFGLAAVGNTLYAFTRNTTQTPPNLGLLDVSLAYAKIPNASTTLNLSDYDVFNGRLYVSCVDSAGASVKARNPHYYPDSSGVFSETEGSGKGFYIRSFQTKMYAVSGQYINFSAVNDARYWDTLTAGVTMPSGATYVTALPATGTSGQKVFLSTDKLTYTYTTTWGTGVASSAADLAYFNAIRTGAGNINISLQEGGSAAAQGIEVYYGKLAIMSEATTQIWSMDPDPSQNQLSQVLRATGTIAPRSVQQYGSGDVLFLANSGIRSLKARDASNNASVTDVGSPIDQYIRDMRIANGAPYMSQAAAALEPVSGRFWMVFPREIMVLSYFPGPKITGWSSFQVPFNIDWVVSAGDRLFVRSGDDLYLYGGLDNDTYDNTMATVTLPYLSMGKPGHMKQFLALDATVYGTWQVGVSYNYDYPTIFDTVGTLTQPTWGKGQIEMIGYDSQFALKFTTTAAMKAKLCNCAVHYQMADSET